MVILVVAHLDIEIHFSTRDADIDIAARQSSCNLQFLLTSVKIKSTQSPTKLVIILLYDENTKHEVHLDSRLEKNKEKAHCAMLSFVPRTPHTATWAWSPGVLNSASQIPAYSLSLSLSLSHTHTHTLLLESFWQCTMGLSCAKRRLRVTMVTGQRAGPTGFERLSIY